MTAFKKTIAGKILGGAAKVFLPIAAAVTGVGAITGMAKGIGAVAGVKNLAGGAVKGIDAVATKAADLVTGLTAEQRKVLRAQKNETKDAKDALEYANRLIKAGATKAEAYAAAGIPLEEISGYTGTSTGKMLLMGGAVLAGIMLLAKLGKKR